MGLKDKVTASGNNSTEASETFTEKEAAFITAKLRQAQYTGAEFEQFYLIMSKLQDIVEKKQK